MFSVSAFERNGRVPPRYVVSASPSKQVRFLRVAIDGRPSAVDEPPAEILFSRRLTLRRAITELWRFRELVYVLAERDFRSRYKQAVLGFAWALVGPLVLVLVLGLLFQRVVEVDTNGTPYVLFSYIGVLPWTFFSASINQGGLSLLNNAQLINKVYAPREVFPLAAVGVAGVDLVLSLVALAVLFVITGEYPQPTSFWVVPLFVVQLAFTVGCTVLISAVVVRLRDVRHILPIVLQLGLFATPVAYGMNDLAQGKAVYVYAAINPLAPVIDGYRRCVLWGEAPQWGPVGVAAVVSFAILLGGYRLFKRLEVGIADAA